MALKDIAINIKATGVDPTVTGMKTVENAAESMGRKVNSATASSSAAMNNMVNSVANASGATARVGAAVEDAAVKGAAAMAQMHGGAHGASLGMTDLESGIHAVVMRVMNLTMAAALIAAPFVAFFALVKHGLTTVDEFQVAVLQIAAQLTQMQAAKGGNLGQIFQQSAAYAAVMVEKLEEIDANSFANNKGLTAMLQTMTMQGTVLDVNNEKQVKVFTSLSNAIAMYTAGQDQEIQARQEMRALLTGEVNQHSQLARIIDTQIKQQGIYKGGLKELVKLGDQHGDTLERLGPYLAGIDAASGAINKTWSAASSSMETAVNKVTREGFQEAFTEIVPMVSSLAGWLKESSGTSDLIRKTWLVGKGVIGSVVDIVKALWVVTEPIRKVTGQILEGWGLLLSSVLPVLADEFFHLVSLLAGMAKLGVTFGAVMLDAVGAVGSALVSVGKAALQALTGDFEGAGKTLQGMFSGVYVDRFKENMGEVKGIVGGLKNDWIAMQNPFDRVLDKVDQYLTKTGKAKSAVPMPAGLGGPKSAPAGPGIDNEQYEREQERFREAYRGLNAAYDKAALDDQKHATALQVSELKNRHAQGLLTEQQFLDEKYRIDTAASNKDIEQLMAAADRAQEAYNAARNNPILKNRPADGADAKEIDRYNNAVLFSVRAEKELVEATDKVSAAVAKAKQLDIDYAGATWAATQKATKERYAAQIALASAIGDTTTAAKLQAGSDQLNRLQLDDMTKAILKQIDALKQRKAEYELAHANDELKDRVALNDGPDYRRQEVAMEQSYRRQMELEREKYAVMVKGSAAAQAQMEKMNLMEREHQQESQKLTKESWKNNVGAISNAMGQIGQILMQGSREQFEAGKALMYAQAVMGAALAIIQAYAQLGPIGGSIAAVGIGVATAVQIATIADTEYKPRAMGGPVEAGGHYLVGEQGPELIRMGSAGTVIPNHALAKAGEEQLRATRRNTEAIESLANTFHEVSGSLSDLVLQSTNNGLVSSRIAGMALDKPGKHTMVQTVIDAVVNTTLAPLRVANAYLSSVAALFSMNWKKLGESAKNMLQGTWDLVTLGFGGSLFGGKKSISGSGLVMGYSNGGIAAAQYTDVHTSGGLFAHSKNKTYLSALDKKLLESFDKVSDGIAHSVETAGKALGGLNLDLSKVSLGLQKLDLRGMSEEQANKAIEQWFSNLATAMADKLGGPEAQAQLKEATRFGETSYQALMRITIALQTVNEAAAATGHQLLEAGIANAELASTIVDNFGGVDKFTEAIDKYNKVVNSDSEYQALKVAAAHRAVSAALSESNVAIPQTVAEYRRLVESTDMSSPLYATLVGLADQFGTIGDAAASAADQMKTLQETLQELRTSTDAGVSPENRYNTLSTTFSIDASRALSGDVEARGRIAAEASAFLAASREYYGSGSGYQDDYRSVTATLTSIMQQLAAANDLDLPQFASGTPRLPYDMTARIHANEMIVDAQSSEVLRRYGIQVKGDSASGSEEEQKETNRHLAALVGLQAEANRQMIEKLDNMERRLAGLEATARRQQAA